MIPVAIEKPMVRRRQELQPRGRRRSTRAAPLVGLAPREIPAPSSEPPSRLRAPSEARCDGVGERRRADPRIAGAGLQVRRVPGDQGRERGERGRYDERPAIGAARRGPLPSAGRSLDQADVLEHAARLVDVGFELRGEGIAGEIGVLPALCLQRILPSLGLHHLVDVGGIAAFCSGVMSGAAATMRQFSSATSTPASLKVGASTPSMRFSPETARRRSAPASIWLENSP